LREDGRAAEGNAFGRLGFFILTALLIASVFPRTKDGGIQHVFDNCDLTGAAKKGAQFLRNFVHLLQTE
jgi:hypothetical protein